jgi:hypothetical protein
MVMARAAGVAPSPQVQILEQGRSRDEPPPTTQAAAEFLRQELKTIFRTGVSIREINGRMHGLPRP